VVPTEALKITGQTKYYDTKGDSGHIMSRGFCPDCGRVLFGETKAMHDLTVVLAGSLDDPSWYRPGMNIYTASSQPWDYMNPDLPKFQKTPQN